MDVGEIGVKLLISDGTELTGRIWEHTYNGRDYWQYGEATIQHVTGFHVSVYSLLYSIISMYVFMYCT